MRQDRDDPDGITGIASMSDTGRYTMTPGGISLICRMSMKATCPTENIYWVTTVYYVNGSEREPQAGVLMSPMNCRTNF